jgi:hypothetical protein
LVEVDGDEFIVGRPLKLKFVGKTQYNDCVLRPDMQVQFVIKRGANISSPAKIVNDSAKIMRTLTVFNDLVNLEKQPEKNNMDERYKKLRELQEVSLKLNERSNIFKAEPYRSICMNTTRFKALTAMPTFSDYSLEELRWAYELGNNTVEILKVEFKNGYESQWTPNLIGRYHIEASVDGFTVPCRVDFNIKPPQPSKHPSAVPPTPMHRPKYKPKDPMASRSNKAQCPAISSYAGARIRSHPTLNAQIIGAIPRGATIHYVETLRNTDGLWLKLADDVRALYCSGGYPIKHGAYSITII